MKKIQAFLWIYFFSILALVGYADAQTLESPFVNVSDGLAPVVTVGTYAAKDSVGGKLKIAVPYCPSNSLKFTDLRLYDLNGDQASNVAQYTVYFKTTPFLGTLSNKTGFSPTDAELPSLLASITVATTDHNSLVNNGYSSLSSLRSQAKYTVDTTRVRVLYVAVVSDTAGVVFASTADFSGKVTMECDK